MEDDLSHSNWKKFFIERSRMWTKLQHMRLKVIDAIFITIIRVIRVT